MLWLECSDRGGPFEANRFLYLNHSVDIGWSKYNEYVVSFIYNQEVD